MKITNDSSPNTTKKVSFERTIYTGRKIELYIEASKSLFNDENPLVNIPETSLQLEDIPEFIKAIELAAMIANGDLIID